MVWPKKLKDLEGKAKIAINTNRTEDGLFGDSRNLRRGLSELKKDYSPGYRFYYTIETSARKAILGEKGA